MNADLLRPACELALAVAREGMEAADPVDPPPSLRSYLYAEELPPKALTAAQRVIDEDAEFRDRVALKANEREVGRAGYLWLHRPVGWAIEFEREAGYEPWPTSGSPNGDFDPSRTNEHQASPPDGPMATVTPIRGGEPLVIDFPVPPAASLGRAAVTNAEHADVDPPPPPGPEPNPAGLEAADALESELDNLGGLVARLANQRGPRPPDDRGLKSSMSGDPGNDESARDGGVGSASSKSFSAPPGSMGDTVGLRSDLDSANHALQVARADLSVAQQKREEAQRLQSEALKRQVQLERELATARDRRAELEAELSASQARLISIEDRFGRLETKLSERDRDRGDLLAQLDVVTTERNEIRDERASLRVERGELRARLDDIDEKTSGIDPVELVQSQRAMAEELESTSRQLARIVGQAESYEEQLKTITAEAATIKAERIDLQTRLDETRSSLEVTSTQNDALRTAAEQNTAELGALRDERDGLQAQLVDLQSSLSEVLEEQAEGRQRNDADRKALNELRVEYDVVVARLADLEQSAEVAQAKADGLTTELDTLAAGRDELLEERGQLRAELATAVSERGNIQEQLANVQERLRAHQTELQTERRERSELASRLVERDNQSERAAAEHQALSEERDSLLETIRGLEVDLNAARSISRERDELQSELVNTRATSESTIESLRSDLEQSGAEIERLQAARAEGEEEVSTLNSQMIKLKAELVDAEILRRERDDLADEIAAARAAYDESIKALRYDVEAAGKESERLEQARAEMEQQLNATRADLTEQSSAADESEELRKSVEARDSEIRDLRSELEAVRSEAEAASVALREKETELQAALEADQARGSKPAKADGLAGALAGSPGSPIEPIDPSAGGKWPGTGSAPTGTEDASRVEAGADPSASTMPGAGEGRGDLAAAQSDLDQANAELDQLRDQLAAARVELASTAAELESRDALAGHNIAAPPVDPLPRVGSAGGQVNDELDSMAVELRSALHGPSMLDTIAGSGEGSGFEAATDAAGVDTQSVVGGPASPVRDAAGGLYGVESTIESAESASTETPVGPRIGRSVADLVAPSVLDGGFSGSEMSRPDVPESDYAGADLDVTAHGTVPGVVEWADSATGIDDDELDAVSELISMKVSSFTPGEASGPPSGDGFGRPGDSPVGSVQVPTLGAAGPQPADPSPPSVLGQTPDDPRPVEPVDLGVRRASGSKRRQIDVPADLLDDEVAVARYVVGSTDVVLLVDGDSVAQLGWPSLQVAQQRDALVTYLADLSATSGAAPDVVFDGRLGDGDSLPASREVRIRLSTPPTPPTAALDELVDAYPEQWPIALVTDNTDLAASAAGRGAAVLNNGQLLDLFIAE